VRDELTGEEATLQAAAVVNATGPWCDRLRQLEDPAAAPLLRITKGAHVMVHQSRLGNEAAITLTSPIDGRVMFVLPWGEFSYIGTTDTDYAGSLDDVVATPEDVTYLLRSANAAFPNAHLADADVLSTWAGLRALIAPPTTMGESHVSREHLVVTGPGGMVTVAGGKLTTYRKMAAEVVDRVSALLHQYDGRPRAPRPPTDLEPLPGGEVRDLGPLVQPGLDLGLPAATVDHLVRLYGTESAAIFNLVREERSLATPLSDDHPAIEAEVLHVTRRELARRLDDVLVRRLHLYYETADHGQAAAVRAAALMAGELGWSPEQAAAEVERYRGTAEG
jgi:glycerol-3-phosphate dehydrogenase